MAILVYLVLEMDEPLVRRGKICSTSGIGVGSINDVRIDDSLLRVLIDRDEHNSSTVMHSHVPVMGTHPFRLLRP